MTCKWCGSSKHDSDRCYIRDKLKQLESGETTLEEEYPGVKRICDGKLEDCAAQTHQEYVDGSCDDCD